MKHAADRLVQRNDQLGRNTYGYVLGAHFAVWSRLQLAWQEFGTICNAEITTTRLRCLCG